MFTIKVYSNIKKFYTKANNCHFINTFLTWQAKNHKKKLIFNKTLYVQNKKIAGVLKIVH